MADLLLSNTVMATLRPPSCFLRDRFSLATQAHRKLPYLSCRLPATRATAGARTGSPESLVSPKTIDQKTSVIDDSNFVAQNLIFRNMISMAVDAVVKLGIIDILASAEGRKPLSAEEILQQLPTKSTPGPTSVRNVQRLLSPLVREGLFTESLNGDAQPVFGLTKVSEWFIRGSPISIAPVADLMYCQANVTCMSGMSEAILDETTTAFEVGHGVPPYKFFESSEDAPVFHKGMEAHSNMFFKAALDSLMESGVLDGVNTLVDVGGGWGHTVAEVVAKAPHIRGINYDLAYVVADAPAKNGVEHVSGSFFESVPSGDTMILKFILHNHGDEVGIRVLKNCFNAMPAKNGKVIVAELVIDTESESAEAEFVYNMDLAMLAWLSGARERSAADYQAMLAAAGFPRSKVTRNVGGMTFIEGFKE